MNCFMWTEKGSIFRKHLLVPCKKVACKEQHGTEHSSCAPGLGCIEGKE